MNILTVKKIGLGLAFTATVIAAKAQKTYTQGVVNYNVNSNGTDVDAKSYFKADSSTFEYSQGPAALKMISNKAFDYFAILVDVPVASIKKAAISTPGEIEEAMDAAPSFTFTATNETKKIGDYNCTKYTAKEIKSGTSYDLWITKDIMLPANILTRAYATVAGTPVIFTFLQAGMGGKMVAQTVTLKSVSDDKVPAGTFKIPADFDKMSMSDLKAMGGRRQ
jgi:hypothetical protein